jgi:hypothetical protein
MISPFSLVSLIQEFLNEQKNFWQISQIYIKYEGGRGRMAQMAILEEILQWWKKYEEKGEMKQ